MTALRNPLFRRLLVGEAVSSFGDSALYLSLGIWAKDLTGSDAAAGLVFLFLALPGLISPLYGHVVDRVRRRPLLVAMYGTMALVVLALTLVRSADQIWILYAVALAYGVTFSVPAHGALLKDILPSAAAVSARAALITVRQGVRIASPVAGAGIYLAFGGGTLAVVDAVTFVVAILVLASLKIVESEPEPAGQLFLPAVTAGFRYLWRVPLLVRLALASTIFMATVGLMDTAVFIAIDRGLGQPAAFFGVLTTVQGAGSVVGGLLAGTLVRRLGEARGSSVGYAVFALGAGTFLVPSPVLFLAGAAIYGLAIPLFDIALGTAQHLYVPARLQGRVGAAIGMLSTVAQSVSIAAGAALAGIVDYRIMYALIALTALACAALILLRPAPVPEVVPSVADERAVEHA
ncbi:MULTISPECIES: MFS transporter [Streptosporangium]|uniref:MFS family permease n=1 Tax=Streptosporangium brasiliense TaxID=47480 RepID=A0ABT9RKB2_9ACTN|nr:MFS transporter [Streptosporangium brasiliense]MDP9869743.1 MFS family permease [Streptosporangium brasiliense]